MNTRLRRYATENAEITARGGYAAADGTEVTISHLLDAAMDGTRCHAPGEALGAPPADRAARIEVTAESSLEAARRLVREGGGEVAVLNFASARNPGGGYLGGARAQEEDLCRHALLYPCLLRAPEYYEAHRGSGDLLYSDRVIWSPGVPVHRAEDGSLLAEPFPVSFLTCPAPNAGALLAREPDARPRIREALHRRAARVLEVAAHHGVPRLVLGAWGCGVFRNDPREVAQAFHAALAPGGACHAAFTHVVFAVWDRSDPSPNRTAFAEVFADDALTPRRTRA
jgi:uncharacterized protein (TIGR02452 family)